MAMYASLLQAMTVVYHICLKGSLHLMVVFQALIVVIGITTVLIPLTSMEAGMSLLRLVDRCFPGKALQSKCEADRVGTREELFEGIHRFG